MKQFSKAVCERIGHYVYILKDPRDNSIFYVGKGTGNRVFNHVDCALTMPHSSDKLDQIRDIHKAGLEVGHFILRHGLSEEQAFEIESACIDLLGIENLSNEQKGHNWWEHGLKSTDEVSQHYDATVVTITEPTVIININRLYRRFMSPAELYQATRHKWKVGHRRNTAKYAIASFRGLVREVYEIDSWTQCPDGRWEFHGRVADNSVRDKYINQSLDNYSKKGVRNPIKYTF